MDQSQGRNRRETALDGDECCETDDRLRTDGGSESNGDREDNDSAADSAADDARSGPSDDADPDERPNVEVTEAGESEPVDPKWQKPDIEDVEDIPEVDGPKTRPADATNSTSGSGVNRTPKPGDASAQDATPGRDASQDDPEDPTAGMPNTARTPGQSRLKEGGADGLVVALELCARLPDEVRLPEEAADLVPVALEAELEQDVQSFAAEEFDNPAPHVETLDFVEADGELWLRLRLGVSPASFDDFDPDVIRDHALQQVDGLL